MRVRILGSAAAEGIPALWCECPLCQHAHKHGGFDRRRRTCYLLDEDTLVDFGPDIFWQVTEFKVDLLKISRLVFTHSHVDHLNPVDLLWRRRGYSVVSRKIGIFGNEAIRNRIVKTQIEESATCDSELLQVDFFSLQPGQPVEDGDLRLLPLPASHTRREQPLFYAFSRQGKHLLIANDTGFPEEEAWTLLQGLTFDMVIMDCTDGAHPVYKSNQHGHMGADVNIRFRDRLRDMGCLTDTTICVSNHFSHNCLCTHAQLSAYLNPHGIQVGYDGMEIEL